MIQLIKFSKNDFGFYIFYGETFIRIIIYAFLASVSLFVIGIMGVPLDIALSVILIKKGDDYIDEIIFKIIKRQDALNLNLFKSKQVYEIFTYTYGVDESTNSEIIEQWDYILSNLHIPFTLVIAKQKLDMDIFKKDDRVYNDLFSSFNIILDHYFVLVNRADAARFESIIGKSSLSFRRLKEEEVDYLEGT